MYVKEKIKQCLTTEIEFILMKNKKKFEIEIKKCFYWWHFIQ